jgi:hypothetical protein
LGIPQKARDSHFPTAPAAIYPPSSRLTVQMSYYDVCGTWGQVNRMRYPLSPPSSNRVKANRYVLHTDAILATPFGTGQPAAQEQQDDMTPFSTPEFPWHH